MMHVHIRIDDRFEFLGIAELNLENGCILFEIKDVPEETAREAMRLAANKLPIKCKFVKKEMDGEV